MPCVHSDKDETSLPSSSSLLYSVDNLQHTSEVLGNDTLDEILSEQQEAWEDATNDKFDGQCEQLIYPNQVTRSTIQCFVTYKSMLANLLEKLISSW